MTISTRTLLFDPDTFFARREPNPAFPPPALIVAVLDLLNVATPVPTVWVFDGDLRAMPDRSAVFLPVSFVATFVVWSLYGVAFYAISSVFDAEGSLRDTVAVAGWGFLPSIVRGLLLLVLVVLFLESTVARGSTPSSGSALAMTGVVAPPILKLVSVLFTLWSAVIWVAAVRHVRNVTRRQAVVSVGIPVLVSVGVSVTGVSIPA